MASSLPHVEVNASSVVENPRESSFERSSFSVFGNFGLGRRVPPASSRPAASAHAPMHAVPHAEITSSDFLGYISQLRAARRKARLDADEAEAADYAADIASGGGAGSTCVVGGSALATPAKRGILTPFFIGATPRSAELIASGADAFTAVPSRFFDAVYDIKDPREFATLISNAAPFDQVQDSLGSYLDLVECQLLASIQARARQFFEALTELQALRERVVAGNLVASQMRRTLAALKQKNCETPLRMIAMHRRRRRKTSVLEILMLVRDACAAPAAIGAALHAGDLNGALDAIGSAQSLVRGQLGQVACLADVRRKLEGYEMSIGADLTKRFSRTTVTLIVIGSPSSSNTEAPSPASPGGGGDNSSSRGAAFDAALEATVRPLVNGLVRVNRLADGLEALQGDLVSEMKEVVRSEVVEAVRSADVNESPLVANARSLDAAEGSASAERLQSLSSSAFISVLSAVCNGLLELLQRLQAIHELIESVLDVKAASSTTLDATSAAELAGGSRAASTGPLSTSWQSIDAALGLGAVQLSKQSTVAASTAAAERQIEVQRWRAVASGVLAVAMDAAQRHVSRLLGTRREQSLRLRIADIRRLWDTATGFSTSANAILSRASAAVALSASASASSGVVWEECLAQVRAHLNHVHTQNSESMGELLDVEQWKQADVPQQVQAVADAIASAVSATSQHGSGGVLRAAESPSASAGGGPLLLTNQRDSSKTLIAAGTAYPFVASGVMLIKMLGDYSSVAEAFPEVTAEAISCTVQLLRLFNTRATALVLGAGALQSAQLKRITAKHLALTSQTLGGILALLPALRAMLLMRLPPQQHVLLSEMAAVTADLIAHDNRLRAKLVSIVKDLMTKCCADMSALPWGQQTGAALPIPSPPISEFITGITTLHRILSTTFRRHQVVDVYSRILLMANAHLPSQYAALIAKLATAAAAAAAALVAPTSTSVPHMAAPTFDRAIAVERMGCDLRVLMAQLDALRLESSSLGNERSEAHLAGAGGAGDASHDSIAADQASIEALASLNRWVERDFCSRVASEVPEGANSGVTTLTPTVVPADVEELVEGGVAEIEIDANDEHGHDGES